MVNVKGCVVGKKGDESRQPKPSSAQALKDEMERGVKRTVAGIIAAGMAAISVAACTQNKQNVQMYPTHSALYYKIKNEDKSIEAAIPSILAAKTKKEILDSINLLPSGKVKNGVYAIYYKYAKSMDAETFKIACLTYFSTLLRYDYFIPDEIERVKSARQILDEQHSRGRLIVLGSQLQQMGGVAQEIDSYMKGIVIPTTIKNNLDKIGMVAAFLNQLNTAKKDPVNIMIQDATLYQIPNNPLAEIKKIYEQQKSKEGTVDRRMLAEKAFEVGIIKPLEEMSKYYRAIYCGIREVPSPQSWMEDRIETARMMMEFMDDAIVTARTASVVISSHGSDANDAVFAAYDAIGRVMTSYASVVENLATAPTIKDLKVVVLDCTDSQLKNALRRTWMNIQQSRYTVGLSEIKRALIEAVGDQYKYEVNKILTHQGLVSGSSTAEI